MSKKEHPSNHQPAQSTEDDSRGSSPITIWLLSQNEPLRLRIERALSSEPVRILGFRMQVPLEITGLERPRAALLDVGDDLILGGIYVEELQRRLRGVPLVVLTNNLDHEFGIQIISKGIRHFFEYDFNAKEFQEIIRNLMARPTLH